VFVADAGNRIIWRYDHSGNVKGRIGEKNAERRIPGFIVPSPFFDVKVARDGLLRVTNTGRHQVELYTPEGDLELSWGRPGAAIENFCGCCNPIATAPHKDGRLVTLEKGIPRVKVYTAKGVFESVVAGPESFAENAKVCGPNDCTLGGLVAAVDAKGRIYILDLVVGNIRVMEEKV
jgi:sugar lactone lactonase YvrE